MLRYLIAAVLCIKAVFGTTCWTSNPYNFRGEVPDGFGLEVTDCAVYTEQLMRMLRYRVDLNYTSIDYNCYTLTVDSDTSYDGHTMYGCVPKGTCRLMEGAFLRLINRHPFSGGINDADCQECNATNCNNPNSSNRVRRSIVNFSFLHTIAEMTAIALGVPVTDSL